MTIEHRVTQIQAISGLLFSSFSLLHLGGHGFSIFSFKLADAALFASRELYQNPLIEPLLFGSLGIHISASLYKYFTRKNTKMTVSSPSLNLLKWHRWFGLGTIGIVTAHIFSSRIAPLLFLKDPSVVDLTIITNALTAHPLVPSWIFIPLYVLFTSSILFHTLFGIQRSFQLLNVKSIFKLNTNSWKWILGIGSVLSGLTVLGVSGFFETILIPKHAIWESLHASMMNSIGMK